MKIYRILLRIFLVFSWIFEGHFFRVKFPKKVSRLHREQRPRPRRQPRPRLRYDIISYDMISYDIISYDIMWYDIIWYHVTIFSTTSTEMTVFSTTSTGNDDFQHHLDWEWPFSAPPRLEMTIFSITSTGFASWIIRIGQKSSNSVKMCFRIKIFDFWGHV